MKFQGVVLNDIQYLEDLLTLNILIYDVHILDENIIRQCAG